MNPVRLLRERLRCSTLSAWARILGVLFLLLVIAFLVCIDIAVLSPPSREEVRTPLLVERYRQVVEILQADIEVDEATFLLYAKEREVFIEVEEHAVRYLVVTEDGALAVFRQVVPSLGFYDPEDVYLEGSFLVQLFVRSWGDVVIAVVISAVCVAACLYFLVFSVLGRRDGEVWLSVFREPSH
jgi:hypothetical protein